MTSTPARFVYLASQSPRRRQLLAQIGVPHELLLPAPGDDAEALEAEVPGERPAAYVERVTRLKLAAARARLVASGRPDAPVLCADTTVALGHRILGKPVDAADAVAALRVLAGRTHRVLTAVAVASSGGEGGRIVSALSISSVRFGIWPDDAIARYVASGEPEGKAGSYAIQGAVAAVVERIEGSYSGIMGLPLFETAALLRQVGIEA